MTQSKGKWKLAVSIPLVALITPIAVAGKLVYDFANCLIDWSDNVK